MDELLTAIICNTSDLKPNGDLDMLLRSDYGSWVLKNLYPQACGATGAINRRFLSHWREDPSVDVPEEQPNRLWLLRILFALSYLGTPDTSLVQEVVLEDGLPNLDYKFSIHQTYAWSYLADNGGVSDDERFKVFGVDFDSEEGLNTYLMNQLGGPIVLSTFHRLMRSVYEVRWNVPVIPSDQVGSFPVKLGDIMVRNPSEYCNKRAADLILAMLGKPAWKKEV
ncbi:hypothetical protein BDR26DRAFT_867234 [Obelidium mucronatum]|nr:hypothetical protein BDR26DRAFT_867234 [Obelidium mucronatum]